MPQIFLRLLALALVPILLAACVTDGLQKPPSDTPPVANAGPVPVRVTMLLPLSGKDAALGEALQNAATLAMTDLGYDGFELGFEDTAAGGVASATKRALQDKTDLILGPVFAPDVRAARGIAAGTDVPIIAFSTDTGASGPGTYLIGLLPGDQARQMGEFAGARGLKNILVIAPRDSYGQLTAQAFATAAQKAGVSVTGPFWLDQNNQMLATRLRALIAPGSNGKTIDGIFMPLAPEQAVKIIDVLAPTLADLPAAPILMGTGLWDDVNMSQFPRLTGAYYAAPPRGARARFESIYTRQFGARPPRLAALGYDAAALALTLGRQGSTPTFATAQLTRANGFTGINGLFRFNSGGGSERALPILQLQPGSPIIIAPAATHFAAP